MVRYGVAECGAVRQVRKDGHPMISVAILFAAQIVTGVYRAVAGVTVIV